MYSEKVLENARKSIDIAEAILQGKEIESKFGDTWIDCRDPLIGIAAAFIRVKPETKLVPFNFSDAESLIGKSVKLRDGSTFKTITFLNEQIVAFGGFECDYADLFKRYTFLDGSPCGKIKE